MAATATTKDSREKPAHGKYLIRKAGPEKHQRQVEEYVTWVNSHLKKRTGVPVIYDLHALQDGTTLVNLVEILSKQEIIGVDRSPTNQKSKKNNIDIVFKFLEAENVQLPEHPQKELYEGSVKGLLRIVLSIADHYRPWQIRRAGNGRRPTTRPANQLGNGRDSSMSSPRINNYSPIPLPPIDFLSQQQTPLDVDINPTPSPRRESDPYAGTHSHHFSNYPAQLGGGVSPSPHLFQLHQAISSSDQYLHHGNLFSHSHYQGSDPQSGPSPTSEFTRPSIGSSPVPSSLPSRNIATPISGFTGVMSGLQRYTDSMISPPITGSSSGTGSPAPPTTAPPPETPLPTLDSSLLDINQVKGQLLQLYALLRENPDGEEGDLMEVKTSPSLTEILGQNGSSYMEPLLEETGDIQQLRDEYSSLQVESDALRRDLTEKDEVIRQLKSDILRLDYKTETEREELRNFVSEKQLVIEELDLRVREREAIIQEQNDKMEDLKRDLDELHQNESEKARKLEVYEIETRDLKQALSHQRISGGSPSSKGAVPEMVSTEAEVIRQSLNTLRKESAKSQQPSLDSLEQSLARVMDQLSILSVKRSKHREEKEKRHERKLATKRTFGVGDGVSPKNSTPPAETVKVLYTLDKDQHPFKINVPISGPVPTLGDFKSALGRKGQFKYFFKTLEEGSTCRVELTDDFTPLPSMDGKYIGWVNSI